MSGRVVNTLDQAPIRKALVQLNGDQSNIAILSDDQGGFSIPEQPAGNYTLRVSKTGYQESAAQAGYGFFQLGPARTDIAVKLEPLASVEGRVLDGSGDPIQGLEVDVLSRSVPDGSLDVKTTATVATDASGWFRLWDISPGEYYLRVAGRQGYTAAILGQGTPPPLHHQAVRTTYYGGGTSVADAQVIHLNPGETLEANFSLAMLPAYKISGHLSGLQIYTPISFELIDQNRRYVPAIFNLQTGQFWIFDVPSGTYTLRVSQSNGTTTMRGEAHVNVVDNDTQSVDLRLSDGVPITGSMVHLEKDPGPGLVFGAMVTLTDLDPVDRTPYTMLPAQDGSARLEHMFPGTYRVQAVCPGGFVSSLNTEQEDLLAAHTLKIGESPSALQLTCSNKTGNVNGTIDANEPIANAPLLFLDQSGKGDPVLVWVNGREFQTALAPGTYRAYLLPDGNSIEYRNPAVAGQLQGGVDVQVNCGEMTRVTLNRSTR